MEIAKIDESTKEALLEIFKKTIDAEGYLIEVKTKKRLVCPYSKEQIKADNFSILPGSATFVNNYYYCFSEYMAENR